MSDTSLVFSIIGKDRTGPAMNSASANLSKLKVAAAVGFGAIAGALGKSISLASSFDKTIRQVGSNANLGGAQLKEMSDLALHLGAVTSFSAQDAADAMLELSKGGLTSAQIKAGALAQTLTLAAAGELTMGDAATVMSNALATFGMKAEDAGQVAAALAGAALASTASVSSLSQGLGNVGAVARTAGLSIQETAGILAEFDQNGIKGAEGGTQLKSVLLKLEAPSGKAADVMHKLGLNVRDATGHLKPMGDISQILQDRLKGLSKAQQDAALKTIFGTYAIQGANVMMQNGAKGLKGYTDAANDMNAAQKMAATNTAGASGAMEQFKGSVETLGIKIGLALLPMFDKVTRKAAGLVNGLTDMVDPAIQAFGQIGDALKPMGKSISDALGKMDFSKLGDSLKTSAQSWAGSLISGVQTGLNNGNWAPLGKSLGDGLGKALGAATGFGAKVAGWLLGEFGSVNWFGVGEKAVEVVIPFIIGLAEGIINNGLPVLLSTLSHHLKDTFLAAIGVALLPEAWAGRIAVGLARIPLAGKLLAWGFKAFRGFGKGVLKVLGEVASEIGMGLLRGLERIFPRISGKFTGLASSLPGKLRSVGPKMAYEARFLALRAEDGLKSLPGKLASLAGRAAEEFLVRIAAGFQRVDEFLHGVPGRIIGVFADAGSWLIDAGKALMEGLTSGIKSMASAPIDALKSVAGKAIHAVTHPWEVNSPSKVTMRLGHSIIEGLTSGIKTKQADALAAVKDLVSKMKDKLQTIKDFAKQIKDSFIATADLTNLTGEDNAAMGLHPNGAFSQMVQNLQGQADNAAAFASAISQLRKLGLNETTIGQLRDAGPDGGLAAARTLLGGGAGGVGQVNGLVKQIIGVGEKFAGREAKSKYGVNPYKSQPVTVKAVHSKITIDFTNAGAENALVEAIRKSVRKRGGNVQLVLGK